MSLFIDTSILIEIRNDNQKIIAEVQLLRKKYPSPPKISFITYFEFMFGIRRKSDSNKSKEREFISEFEIVNSTKKTAEIMVNLEDKYNLPLADLIIASQTLEHGDLLVTKDKDFADIIEIEKIIL